MRPFVFIALAALMGCGGLSWNTTVADSPHVRRAMVDSVVPGKTTEDRFVLQWGNPTQKQREGAQTAFIYRDMKNPRGYYVPQFGKSGAYVVVLFQYGLAIGAYSSETEGCRATFAPRPPGYGFENPTTVHPVNCPPPSRGIGTGSSTSRAPMVPDDSYSGGKLK